MIQLKLFNGLNWHRYYFINDGIELDEWEWQKCLVSFVLLSFASFLTWKRRSIFIEFRIKNSEAWISFICMHDSCFWSYRFDINFVGYSLKELLARVAVWAMFQLWHSNINFIEQKNGFQVSCICWL